MADEMTLRTAAQPSSDWWRPTRTLATWLTWLLGAQAVLQFVYPALVDTAPMYVRWHAALDALLNDRNERARQIFERAQRDGSAWSSLLTVLVIATIVLLIVWAWRSAHNARALGRTGARLAPGWAIAAWFIPVANFVLLYVIFSDLWRSSDPATERGDGWRSRPGSALVRLWVVAYIGGSVLGLIGIALALSGVTDVSATRVLLVSGGVIAGIGTSLSILVVRTITARQEAQQAADPAPTTRPLARQYVMPAAGDGPGWYADPAGTFDHRYWDGSSWTEHVSRGGAQSTAPVTPPDWYPDPTGRFHWRYWTGHAWTEHVSRDQELFIDPLDDAP